MKAYYFFKIDIYWVSSRNSQTINACQIAETITIVDFVRMLEATRH